MARISRAVTKFAATPNSIGRIDLRHPPLTQPQLGDAQLVRAASPRNHVEKVGCLGERKALWRLPPPIPELTLHSRRCIIREHSLQRFALMLPLPGRSGTRGERFNGVVDVNLAVRANCLALDQQAASSRPQARTSVILPAGSPSRRQSRGKPGQRGRLCRTRPSRIVSWGFADWLVRIGCVIGLSPC